MSNPLMKVFKDNNNKTAVRQNAFSVYDEKAQAYNLPFFYPQVGLAYRAFTDMVKNESSVIYRHPEDFSLYHIGSFDDICGKMESFTEPKFVARATEVLDVIKNEKLKEITNEN